MFTRILCATDGSEAARKALIVAGELARLSRAEVIVVHAYAPVPVLLGAPYHNHMLNERVGTGQHILDEAAGILRGEGVEAEESLLEGPAADAIVEAAGANRCDLIVMGARGLSDWEGIVVGSVSHDVIREAHCPVLVVR